MANRWFVNPRKRKKRTRGGGKVRRPRVRVHGRTFVLGRRSPFKGRVRHVNPLVQSYPGLVRLGPSRFTLRNPIIRNPIIRNPFIREVGMFSNPRRRHRRRSYRRNPIIRNPGASVPSLRGIMANPLGMVTTGAVGVASAYLTNTIPNMFGLFAGTDLVSKVLRGASRVVVGTFVYGLMRSVSPRNANAAAVGAALGSVGALVLDLANTNLVLGYGDQTRTPMNLIGGLSTAFSSPGVAGYGAYTRPMGRLGAYTRPMGRLRAGMAGIYGPGSMGMMNVGTSIYG